MASGALLVLLGEECKRREEYIGLDKEYEVEVVLGAATDTGDALGLAALNATQSHFPDAAILHALRACTGTRTVPYPAFSSKTVAGKPLFMHALEGTLGGIAIPEHAETIYRISLLNAEELSAQALQARTRESLRDVPQSDEPSKGIGADFRQDAIRARWEQILDGSAEGGAVSRTFTLLRLRVTCASGTYMRTLAERLGRELVTEAFALSIRRTKIGRYVSFGPLGFWSRRYR
jgi:tRNA pseudouridine55 synthase